MSIEIKNVSRRFGDTQALDNVSTVFEGGQIYGLLGNNGAGKSTLLNIISDRLLANSGQVIIDGEAAHGNDRALGKMFLMSEQNLFPDDMKVRDAFKAASYYYPSFDRIYADSLAERFGLNVKKKIKTLSTGYSSIFRLILGLACGADYVFYDEPVLGLDAQHRDLFYRLLIERFANEQNTVVISTHLIAEVAAIVSHTVIIRNGVILKDAPTEELTADAFTVSGPAAAVDEFISGKHVLSASSLGGLKTASVQGKAEEIPAGLELSRLNLQDYFINLMEEEDRK